MTSASHGPAAQFHYLIRWLCLGFACLTCWTGLSSPRTAQAIEFQFDYTYDTLGFFQSAERRAVLELAGSFFERIADHLDAVVPGGPINSTVITFNHPGTDQLTTVRNVVIPEDTVIVYAGGRELPGSTIGFGGPAGWSANGTSSFLNTVSRRGQSAPTLGPTATEYQVGIGVMTFDTTAPWNFSLSGPVSGRDDFLTVAMHELGHILGFGTSDAWFNQVDDATQKFNGAAAQVLFGGPVPVDANQAHWANGIQSTIQGVTVATAMDPTIFRGTREFYTALDIAGLTDIGWEWAQDGDNDLDGDVDSSDLLIFLEGWTGSQDRFTSSRTFTDGDTDFDGDVDSVDLLNTISSWTGAGAERQLAAVPEPQLVGPHLLGPQLWGSLSLGVLACFRRRRRSVDRHAVLANVATSRLVI